MSQRVPGFHYLRLAECHGVIAHPRCFNNSAVSDAPPPPWLLPLLGAGTCAPRPNTCQRGGGALGEVTDVRLCMAAGDLPART